MPDLHRLNRTKRSHMIKIEYVRFFFYEWYTFYSSALNGENHNYVNMKSQAFRLYKLECVKNSFCSKFSRKNKNGSRWRTHITRGGGYLYLYNFQCTWTTRGILRPSELKWFLIWFPISNWEMSEIIFPRKKLGTLVVFLALLTWSKCKVFPTLCRIKNKIMFWRNIFCILAVF